MCSTLAYVWHDEDGNITAVGRASADAAPLQPRPFNDQCALKVSVTEEQLHTLHLTHRIDVGRGLLTQRGY